MSTKPKGKSRAKGRLSPGELDGLVLAHLRKRTDDGPLTAGAVAKEIDRSSGAVANCLARLTKAKKVRLAKKAPRAFVIARTKGE
jgi:hypothetical protein